MTTFLALLPSPHAIRTDSPAAVKRLLASSERVACDYSKFGTNELREMAAATVWCDDANTVISAQTLTALHPAQRATLCRMRKIASAANTAAVVTSLLAALGPPSEGDEQSQDLPAPPAGSFLALLQTDLSDEYASVASADIEACRAMLVQSSLAPAATGSSASVLAKFREASAMARWCYNFLHTPEDFARLGDRPRAALHAALKVTNVQDGIRQLMILAVIDDWRRRRADSDQSSGDKDSTGGSAKKKAAGTKGPAKAVHFDLTVGTALDSPAPPAADFAADGAVTPWWLARLQHTVDLTAATQRNAEHNVLAPNGLGPASAPGSSVWDSLLGAGASAYDRVVLEHGGAHADELRRLLHLLPTLYVDANQLLTQEERSTLASARKSEDTHRRTAAPSLASWPWLQDLRVVAGRPFSAYDMGRMLAVALRVDSGATSSILEVLAREARARDREDLARKFRTASDQGDLSALLLAMGLLQRHALQGIQSAFEVAHGHMAKFPKCPLIVEVAAGRDCQRARLTKFFLTLDRVIREAADLKQPCDQNQYTAGAYLNFFKGYMESAVSTQATERLYMQAGANFGGGGGAAAYGGTGGFGGGSGGSSSSYGTGGGLGGTGSTPPGGFGGTPRGPSAQGGAQRGGQGQGKGSTPAPHSPSAGQPKQNKGQQQKGTSLVFGVNAPSSKAIVGEHIGLDGPGAGFTCWGCNAVGVGHFKGECPTFWGKQGKPLPGFNSDGDREPGEWNGNEPKRATFKKWVEFLEDTNNFAAGAEPATFRGAPDLDAFKDRAARARK